MFVSWVFWLGFLYWLLHFYLRCYVSFVWVIRARCFRIILDWFRFDCFGGLYACFVAVESLTT